MASAVQVKDEPAAAFSADTDSEDDIDIDKLQPLAPKFESSSKFPVGCHVWYNLRSSPEMGHLQAKSARVVEVSIHVENGRRVYKLKPVSPSEYKISFYEDQLFYAIGCAVRVKKTETDESFDGVVVYLERAKGNDGRRQVTYAVQYTADDYITIEPRVAADRIKYRRKGCGVGVGGKVTDDNTRTCMHEGDTDKEEKEADVSSHSSSAESFAHASDGNDSSTARWEPPPPSQPKRGSGPEPKDRRPTKVAKRESRSEEMGEVKRDANKGKAEQGYIKQAENSASVRIITIPRWWKNQWGPANRRQLYCKFFMIEELLIISQLSISLTLYFF